MRVYISGAISSSPDYKKKFDCAEQKLRADGYSVINPTSIDSISDLSYDECMAVDICLLNMCDAIYLLKGWEKSCGANREYGFALAKDMIVMKE